MFKQIIRYNKNITCVFFKSKKEEFDANKYYYNRDGGSLEQMQHHGDNRNFSGYNMNAGYMHNQG